LRGRGNRLNCEQYINNWDLILKPTKINDQSFSAEESIHSLIQGRIIQIGNIRGYGTYCPDKSKTFNKEKIGELTTIDKCPNLQYSDYNSLRNIDVIWFRKANKALYPEYAFEVEITTGVWSGFGRLATLKEYSTKLYVITNENKRFYQVLNSFPDIQDRYTNVIPEDIGLLYSAENNLIKLRKNINL